MIGLLQFVVDGAALGGIVGLLSLAFAISYWPSREVHFGMAAVIVAAAYGYQDGVNHFGFVGGVLIAVVVGCLVGLACKRFVYRGVNSSFGIFLAGYAALVITENALQLAYSANEDNVTPPAAWLGKTVSMGGLHVSGLQITEFVLFLVIWGCVEAYLRRSNAGIQLLGMANNPYLARCMGIPVDKRLRQAYLLGSAVAVVGAVLYAIDQGGITTTFAEIPFLLAVNGVLVGGAMSFTGAAIGGWIIGMVMSVGVWKLPVIWQTSIAMLVLAAVVLVRPYGLFGKREAL